MEFAFWTIDSIADSIRRRDFSVVELAKSALDRIATLDRRLYAFVRTTETRAVQEAIASNLRRAKGERWALSTASLMRSSMYRKAAQLAQVHGWFLAQQFKTEANADIHEATTAREALADFKRERLAYFVSGYGTGGTVTDVARVLRRERRETNII